MARPLSLDLRVRVVAAVGSGRSCRETAAMLDVAVSSVVKWCGRFRETGSPQAKSMGGKRRPYVLEAERDWVLARIKDKPHITTRELAAELAERGVKVSHVSVWNLVRRRISRSKKSVLASEQDRPDVARRRARWRRLQPRLDPSRLVFIDETWAKTNSHKGKAVRQIIGSVGARLLFLPPYSPDLNPIEQAFAKLRAHLRKAGPRSFAATWHRIGALVTDFAPTECRNFLRNSGYGST